jgi:hypothetical protein
MEDARSGKRLRCEHHATTMKEGPGVALIAISTLEARAVRSFI